MPNLSNLHSTLVNLDNRSYKAYKTIKGSYQFPDFTLTIDRVQSDPFASPSQFRLFISHAVAAFPLFLYQSPSRNIALSDYLTRQFAEAAKTISQRRGTGKSGLIYISSVGQEVLQRTSVLISQQHIEVRFYVGLPARGRTILGYQAAELICEDLPHIVKQSLFYQSLPASQIKQHVEVVEDADWIRQELNNRQLIAFIANGAILPRRSGIDPRPLDTDAIAFQSPPSLEVEFDCPNRGKIRGMGIPQGVTLIVGGGYHGKSTLLKALELGVYNHISGDGRELVVTEPTAVKIRAEDGRSVAGVNISPFINHLPQQRSTTNFSTANASGSTSQAANIIEALEIGTKLLLIDEDTAATNFMIRDRRMQQLIAKDLEPITPFVDKVQQLYLDHHVSTILVMGGSGDYFEAANTVIAMENFQPADVTGQAKAIATTYNNTRLNEGGQFFGDITPRTLSSQSLSFRSKHQTIKFKAKSPDLIAIGQENLDLRAVEQLVELNQAHAIAAAIVYIFNQYLGQCLTLKQAINQTILDIQNQGLDVLTTYAEGNLALFRRWELAAAINRLRNLNF